MIGRITNVSNSTNLNMSSQNSTPDRANSETTEERARMNNRLWMLSLKALRFFASWVGPLLLVLIFCNARWWNSSTADAVIIAIMMAMVAGTVSDMVTMWPLFFSSKNKQN